MLHALFGTSPEATQHVHSCLLHTVELLQYPVVLPQGCSERTNMNSDIVLPKGHPQGTFKQLPSCFQNIFSSVQLPTRWRCIGVTACASKGNDKLDLFLFVFCNKNCQYFLSSCSNISPGPPIQQTWVQQVAVINTNEELVHVDTTLDCPKAASIYCSTCGKIN